MMLALQSTAGSSKNMSDRCIFGERKRGAGLVLCNFTRTGRASSRYITIAPSRTQVLEVDLNHSGCSTTVRALPKLLATSCCVIVARGTSTWWYVPSGCPRQATLLCSLARSWAGTLLTPGQVGRTRRCREMWSWQEGDVF